MKLGIASGVYLNYPLHRVVEEVAKAGYDTLDIWSGRPHVYRHDFNPTELRQLRAQVEDQGLTVSSFLPAFYRYPYTLSSPNDIVRSDSVQYMKECMDNAVQLGAPILLIVPERSMEGQSHKDALDRLIDSVVQICDYAEQYDIRLGLEAVNHFVSDMVRTSSEAMKVIAAIEHERLGVVIDTGHINLSSETIVEAIAIPEDKLLQVHVNDNDGQHQQNLIPGEGTFDFHELIRELRNAGYEGVLTVELGYHYTFDPTPAAIENVKRMQSLLEAA
jgi:sugar phosphate isomerase/epimerase